MQEDNFMIDLALGAVAGVAAVWALDRVDWFLYNREPEAVQRRTRMARRGRDPAHTLVDIIAGAMGRSPPGQPDYPKPTALGNAVHYSIGLSAALPYALLRRDHAWLKSGGGSLFGAALWALQDEGLNAISGLSAPPQRYHWRTHARGLVAHVAFGVALETLLKAADALRSETESMPRQRRDDADIDADGMARASYVERGSAIVETVAIPS